MTTADPAIPRSDRCTTLRQIVSSRPPQSLRRHGPPPKTIISLKPLYIRTSNAHTEHRPLKLLSLSLIPPMHPSDFVDMMTGTKQEVPHG